MRIATPLAAAFALVLAACAVEERYGAAEGVRDFLVAVQEDDEQAFERRIDREALRADLKAQLRRSAGGEEALLSRMLEGERGDALIDSMITPQSFRLAAQAGGAPLERTPSAVEIAALLHMTADDEACLRNKGEESCMMTFREDGGVWKLTGLRSAGIEVRTSDSAAG